MPIKITSYPNKPAKDITAPATAVYALLVKPPYPNSAINADKLIKDALPITSCCTFTRASLNFLYMSLSSRMSMWVLRFFGILSVPTVLIVRTEYKDCAWLCFKHDFSVHTVSFFSKDLTWCSVRSSHSPQHGHSARAADPEARVGRNGKTYELGYKLHIAVDAKSELPIAVIVASANDNEKKHAPALLEKGLKAAKGRVRLLVVDSQYSSKNLRDLASSKGVRAEIPFPANQRREKKGLLRVDRFFRTHGPTGEKRLYKLRSSVERVNSRLKEQLCLEKHWVRSIERITVHALLCMIAMLLNAVAAFRLNRVEKARSITLLAR